MIWGQKSALEVNYSSYSHLIEETDIVMSTIETNGSGPLHIQNLSSPHVHLQLGCRSLPAPLPNMSTERWNPSEKGVSVLINLDDWVLIASSREQVTEPLSLILPHIQALGLSVNFQKSSLSPSQLFTFLGQEISSMSAWDCQNGHISQSFSVGTQTALSDDFTTDGYDGLDDCCSAAQPITDATLLQPFVGLTLSDCACRASSTKGWQ